jgi:hypothetical protein
LRAGLQPFIDSLFERAILSSIAETNRYDELEWRLQRNLAGQERGREEGRKLRGGCRFTLK